MNSTLGTNPVKQEAIASTPLFHHLVALPIILIIASVLCFDADRLMVAMSLRSDKFLLVIIFLSVSVYLVWRKWARPKFVLPEPLSPGIFLFLGISVSWSLANAIGIQIGTQLAIIAIFLVGVLAEMGVSFVRESEFPLAFLLISVPFGEYRVRELQAVTAENASEPVRLTGIPAHRNGLFPSIPSADFQRAEACCGIRYLPAMLAPGTLCA